MTEKQTIISYFLCICFIIFLIGLGIISMSIQSLDSESWVISTIGFVMVGISLSIIIDYELHKLWHLEKEE